MNERISVTIDHETLLTARKYASEHRRSLSNLVEYALARLVTAEGGGPLVTTTAHYARMCTRDEYDRQR